MVAHHAYSTVRHIHGGVFEVVAFPEARTVHVEPSLARCSCGKPDGIARCAHLYDVDGFLVDHHCPSCLAYSPFGVLCAECYAELEVAKMYQAVA